MPSRADPASSDGGVTCCRSPRLLDPHARHLLQRIRLPGRLPLRDGGEPRDPVSGRDDADRRGALRRRHAPPRDRARLGGRGRRGHHRRQHRLRVGYFGGYRLLAPYGSKMRLDEAKLKVGKLIFDRHGGKVVFFGRFVSILRTYAAFLAGINHMNYWRFLVFNAAGGLIWSAIYAFGFYFAGSTPSAAARPLDVAIGARRSVIVVALHPLDAQEREAAGGRGGGRLPGPARRARQPASPLRGHRGPRAAAHGRSRNRKSRERRTPRSTRGKPPSGGRRALAGVHGFALREHAPARLEQRTDVANLQVDRRVADARGGVVCTAQPMHGPAASPRRRRGRTEGVVHPLAGLHREHYAGRLGLHHLEANRPARSAAAGACRRSPSISSSPESPRAAAAVAAGSSQAKLRVRAARVTFTPRAPRSQRLGGYRRGLRARRCRDTRRARGPSAANAPAVTARSRR